MNLRTDSKEIALHLAAQCGHKQIVMFLIEMGSNVNACDKFKDTPLQFAVYWGHFEAVKHLIQNYGAKVNVADVHDWTPLHTAVDRGFLEITKYLISKGARIDVVDKQRNKTPIQLARYYNHKDIMKVFDQVLRTRATRNNVTILGNTKATKL